MEKNFRSAMIVLGVCLVVVAVVWLGAARKTSSSNQGCVAGQNEQCPDAGDWGTLKTFQDKYKAPKDEQDRVNGLWMRLQQTPPDGFHWDGTKMLYVKNPPPLVAPVK